MSINAVFEICKGLREKNMNAEKIAKNAVNQAGHCILITETEILAQTYLDLLKEQEEAEEVWAVFKEAAKIEINHAKKEYKDLLKIQKGMVLVPKDELSKLETARVDLYELLVEHLGEKTLLKFTNITGQIWKVANTKSWDIKQ